MGFDYAGAYGHELEQRDRLRAAATTPIWVLTLLGTVAAYTILQFNYGDNIWTGLFVVPLGIGVGSLTVAIYFLIRALHGHTYKAIEKATIIKQYEEELERWHVNYGNGVEDANQEFDEYLDSSFAKAADINATLNQIRSEYYFLCFRWIISALVFIGIAVMPFIIQSIVL